MHWRVRPVLGSTWLFRTRSSFAYKDVLRRMSAGPTNLVSGRQRRRASGKEATVMRWTRALGCWQSRKGAGADWPDATGRAIPGRGCCVDILPRFYVLGSASQMTCAATCKTHASPSNRTSGYTLPELVITSGLFRLYWCATWRVRWCYQGHSVARGSHMPQPPTPKTRGEPCRLG